MREERTIEEHESYGMAAFSHVSGNATLFGSEFTHQHFVMLRISHGERERDLATDWYHDRKQIIEVAMSEAQFVELISRTNMGAGTPVTIRRILGKTMEVPPLREPMKDRYKSEVRQDAKNCVRDLSEATAELLLAIEEGRIGKTVLRDIAAKLQRAERSVSDGIPFVIDQAAEAMENTVAHARVEIESHISQMAMRIGVDALRLSAVQSAPKLIDSCPDADKS